MIDIPSYKDLTKTLPIEDMAAPAHLYLPLHAYREPMFPVVDFGENVKKYQLLARSKGLFATSVHAPVSGIVTGVKEIGNQSFLVLQNDFEENAMPSTSFDPEKLSKETILQTLANYGIEGSGGARFPTHLKYNTGVKTIDTFIINAAECEPYLNADYALLREKPEEILRAIAIIQKLFHAKAIVFGIERHNKELKPLLERLFEQFDLPLAVKLLPNEYPQGGELQLIKSITGKELPKGGIPADAGIVVSNVGTLWAVYNAFCAGTPYIERIVTVAGQTGEKGNYRIKIGTPVSHILKETGLEGSPVSQTVILGGPMMGKAVESLETPVNKGSGGILILKNPAYEPYNCIGCGYCVDVCPQHLMPMEFVRHYDQKDTENLSKYHLQDCIECGACAYICPSEVPLMESIIKGKKLMAQAK